MYMRYKRNRNQINKENNLMARKKQTQGKSQKSFKIDPNPQKCETLADIRAVLDGYAEYVATDHGYEDENTANVFSGLWQIYRHYEGHRQEVASLLVDLMFVEYFKDFLEYVNSVEMFRFENIWNSTDNVLHILRGFTSESQKLAKSLIDAGYVEYYTDILASKSHQDSHSKDENGCLVLCLSLGTLVNMVKHVPEHESYTQHRLKTVLHPYLTSEHTQLRVQAITLVAQLITDEENSQLQQTGALKFMVNLFREALNSEDHTADGIKAIDLACTLTRMAVNDNNKGKLVEAGVLAALVTLMQTGNEEEQEVAAKLTWTLSFNDKSVKEKLKDEPGYIEALESLCESGNLKVSQLAKGAVWKLSGEDHRQHSVQALTTEDKEAAGQHIFISYQWDHQDIVVKIKDRLKECGYSVWIDVEEMGGSTLDAMAGAVENAAVVLVGASEKYKLSPNCRTEAEYTFQIKKPIVPLMMQRHYKADGWLGMLMGAKLYINFDGKYEFEEAFEMLMKELEPYLKDVAPVVDGATNSTPSESEAMIESSVAPITEIKPRPASPIPVKAWDKKQVMDWARKNKLTKLSNELLKLLENLDGRLLASFCHMKSQAPEYFYRQLKDEFRLKTLPVLRLTEAMAGLDDKHNV